MKRLLLVLSLGLFLAVYSFADERPYESSFCSLVATDGVWALSFERVPLDYNCRRAEDAIRQVTWAPIYRDNAGYYFTDRYNEVSAYCYHFNGFYRGYGAEPLQRAFLELRYQPGCLFYVR